MRTRIALFVPHLEEGGTQVVAVRLANAMAEREDLDVDLLVVRRLGIHLNDLSDRVNVVDLQRRHAFLSIPGLLRYLNRAKPACVLCIQASEGIAAAVARWLSGSETRVIASEHTLFSARTDFPRWRLGLALLGRKFAYRYVDKVVAVSETVAADIEKLTRVSSDKVVVIYNPFDLQKIRNRAIEKPSHPFFGRGVPVLVSAGRLEPQKDFDTLLRAFSILLAQREAFLIVLGEGFQRGELEKLRQALHLEEFVDFAGFATNPFAFMGHADLFVLSTHYEGFPNVIIEAMACDCPVVSTDFPGVREALGDSEYGLIAPLRDPDGLAQKIARMLNSPTPAALLRSRCESLDVEPVVNRYLDVMLAE